ncbi:MAG: hypothetical protein JSS61_00945 [Verrucomicrobia bacterium]|nr:hypothetical protein [Verrucomicrobiota bacterium]
MIKHFALSMRSPAMIAERHNRALLLQFLLTELFDAIDRSASGERHLFPYDWAIAESPLHRAYDHAKLLQHSFPEYKENAEKIAVVLKNPPKNALKTLYRLIEPLILACDADENLLFFLIQHHKAIDTLMKKGHLVKFLKKIEPLGIESLGEKLCDQYHRRGFFSQIADLKLLLTELIHA